MAQSIGNNLLSGEFRGNTCNKCHDYPDSCGNTRDNTCNECPNPTTLQGGASLLDQNREGRAG